MVATFKIQHEVPFGRCVYIVHNLNDWSLRGAIKLLWKEDHVWTSLINISTNFEYKYVVASFENPEVDTLWERGKNRKQKQLENAACQTEFWESRKLSLTLFDKKKEYSKNKCLVMVTGSCGSLESPVQMLKSQVNKKRCYTADFQATIDEIQAGIAYQYLIFMENKFGSEITEIIGRNQELNFKPKINDPFSYKLNKAIC